MRFSKIWLKSYHGSQFFSNWLKFGPDTPYMIPNKVMGPLLKILIFSDFMLIFHQKITKSPNFQKSLHNFDGNHVRSIWSKFQPFWPKTVKPDTIWVIFEIVAFFRFWQFFVLSKNVQNFQIYNIHDLKEVKIL